MLSVIGKDGLCAGLRRLDRLDREKRSREKERQSSSGIIFSTDLGSTGWLKSVFTGTVGIATAPGRPLNANILKGFQLEADYLFYTVREPFRVNPQKGTGKQFPVVFVTFLHVGAGQYN
jgi:hypothetical protein